MSIEVGDAIFKFLGDSTQLDSKFDSVGPKAKAAFGPATEVVKEFTGEMAVGQQGAVELGEVTTLAGTKARESMYQARGEAGLLGEAFGVHLPRHVRSFIAELPGVGEGLSAAFEATAILFVIQAIIQVSEKLSKLTADFLIFTDEMKSSNAEIVRHNEALLKLKDTYDKDEEALEKFGKTALEVAVMKVGKLTKALEDAKNAASHLKDEAGSVELQYSKWGMAIDALTSRLGLGSVMFDKAIAQQTNAVAAAQDKANEALKNTANKERELTLAKKERDAEALKVFQKHIQALNEADTARTVMSHRNMELENEADNARTALASANEAKRIKGVQAENEADTARTELFHKQTELQNEAENARWKMEQDHLKLESEAEDARSKLYAREKKELDDLRKQTSLTFQTLAQQWMKAASPLKQLGTEGQEAFNKITTGLESTVAATLLSQASFGEAMKQMTAQVLASLSSQAIVKGLFYAAEGTAALFTNPPAAAAFFEAAGLMEVVGAIAGVSAHALSGGGGGGGGGSPSTFSQNGGGSNTSGSGQRGTVAVRGFADGGLVTGPTLALIGEKRGSTEAVLPLDNQDAMERIGASVAKHVAAAGGGGGVTVNVAGHVIGANDVAHLVGQINKRVSRGQATLLSSNSLRVTKRSA